jgi:UDP-N-acetylmuramoylalanine--D-glutamate ligase
MSYLTGLHVFVLGLGDSGLAMARWCARNGASTVRVWDSREAPPQAQALRDSVPTAIIEQGALDAGSLAGVQLVLKSPGLAPGDSRVAPLLQAAAQSGIAVQGELDLFARALADLKAERGYGPRVLAITGTNGKTTTTLLTGLLVERAGRRVAVAGNVGPTMLDTLAQLLAKEPALAAHAPAEAAPTPQPSVPDEGRAAGEEEPALPLTGEGGVEEESSSPAAPPDDDDEAPPQLTPPPPIAAVFEFLPEVWVLELSSFQLHGAQGFEPAAATVLNVTQDHLDWHGTMQAYAADKARIFGTQATLVINRDDPMVEAMIPAPVMGKGAKGGASRAVHRKVLRFGLDAPRRPGDFGLVVENGMAWLVRAMESDETVKRRKDEEEEIHLQRLMPADALRMRGRHNAANALAALALATAIGCPLAPMLHGLREYQGEPHRVAFVATIGNVEFFDDSKGTNVGATVAALRGLGADKAPARLNVILGGDGKGQDFAPLAGPLAQYARFVALIGRDAEAIAAAIVPAALPHERYESLEAAVRACHAQSHAGDAVLLSPACASLDMFRNYAHRAEVFAAAVQALADEFGEPIA